jgi:murein DD-endopeptidase MepM/ murein hydrolase activator NlpD
MISVAPPPVLLDAIAQYDGHLIGASRTGSGKTRTFFNAIAHISTITNNGVRWFCASGKMSLWMGMEQQTAEDGQPRVLNVSLSNSSSIEPLLQRLRWAVAIQEAREQERLTKKLAGLVPNPRPYYFVIDEWLIVLKVAKKYGQKAYQELIDLVECLIFKGREDKCYVWLMAQGHQCGSLHLDKDLRRNLGVIALGGAGNYQSITAAISDTDLIEDSSDRDRLRLQYQQLITEDPQGRIYYSSIGGHKVARMEQLPDAESQTLFAPDQQRQKLEDLYQQSTHKPQESAQPKSSPEPSLHEREVKAKELELQLKVRQYLDKSLSPEDKWNFATLATGVIVFTIYVIPPFSGALQTAWRGTVKAGQAVKQLVTGTDSNASYWAPNLKSSPKKGEKIAGYTVTSVFGKREAPVEGASTFHRGVDVGTPIGTNLYAIAKPGEFIDVKCWQDKGGGGLVASYQSQGWKFQYLHLSKCSSGKHTGGSIIAQSGNSGIGSGAHWHFEMVNATGEKVPPYTGYAWWALTGEAPQPFLTQKNDSNPKN